MNDYDDLYDEELHDILKSYKEYADWKELIDLINEVEQNSTKTDPIEELL